MTDLEQVGLAVWAHIGPAEYRDDILAVIDAHLKEDERMTAELGRLDDRIMKQAAELARLREDLKHADEAYARVAAERDRLGAENGQLQEALGYAKDRLDHTEVLPLRVEVKQLKAQRDTLLAAGKRYFYALSVANGTTGPDDRQDALEGLEVAISEVGGEK